ncbi:hypothetical protein DFH07DRAFT_950048 [Mycena maculata]|uniref:Uncharacterized protein n=1 Tax=Mycena maculata TaxID=230809 RepID=A0AAD7KAV3_9AGAR|nr:hypothetical protein DFH07DRAFT_950048 [Mycena maculata]
MADGNIDIATQMTASKARQRRHIAKEERKNLCLWAEGAGETILTPHREMYADALERNWRSERDYLQKVCNEFNARISWRLGDHEEPELPLAEFDHSIVWVEVPEELTEAEELEKRTRQALMKERIRRWLKYRVRRLRKQLRSRLDSRKDPWAILLAQLVGLKSPPKARQAYQQFMHEEYTTKVSAVVDKQWAAANGATGMLNTTAKPNGAFRAKVARDMFAELTVTERLAYATRAKEEGKAAREAYDKAMKAGPSKSPEARQKCIENVGAFLGPILQGIQERTGLHSVTILGGPIPKYDGELRCVYMAYGRNKTAAAEHFPQWGKQRFDDVLALMVEYLKTAFTDQDIEDARPNGLEGALYTMKPDPPVSDSDSGDSDDDISGSDSNDDSDDSDAPRTRKEKKEAKRKEKEKKTEKKAAEKEKRAKEKEKRVKEKENERVDGKRRNEKSKEKTYDELRASIANKKKVASSDSPPKPKRKRGADADDHDGGDEEGIDPTTITPRKSRRLENGAGAADSAGPTPAVNTQVSPTASPTQGAPGPPPPPPPVNTQVPLTPPPTQTALQPPPSPPPLPTERLEIVFPPDCPAWLRDAITWMEDDLGCHFDSLKAALVRLESKYGWESENRRKLPIKGRPAQIHSWIKGGRGSKTKVPPCINDVDEYSKEWATWWDSMQPEWRTRGADGYWEVGGERGGTEEWGALEAPGPNGCLSVVGSLYFWGRVSSQSAAVREAWERGVQDVVWMLEGIDVSIEVTVRKKGRREFSL